MKILNKIKLSQLIIIIVFILLIIGASAFGYKKYITQKRLDDQRKKLDIYLKNEYPNKTFEFIEELSILDNGGMSSIYMYDENGSLLNFNVTNLNIIDLNKLNPNKFINNKLMIEFNEFLKKEIKNKIDTILNMNYQLIVNIDSIEIGKYTNSTQFIDFEENTRIEIIISETFDDNSQFASKSKQIVDSISQLNFKNINTICIKSIKDKNSFTFNVLEINKTDFNKSSNDLTSLIEVKKQNDMAEYSNKNLTEIEKNVNESVLNDSILTDIEHKDISVFENNLGEICVSITFHTKSRPNKETVNKEFLRIKNNIIENYPEIKKINLYGIQLIQYNNDDSRLADDYMYSAISIGNNYLSFDATDNEFRNKIIHFN